jgi:hypothetical protein
MRRIELSFQAPVSSSVRAAALVSERVPVSAEHCTQRLAGEQNYLERNLRTHSSRWAMMEPSPHWVVHLRSTLHARLLNEEILVQCLRM